MGRCRSHFPTSTGGDIVHLALTEIRQYGASSIQVARRLRVRLEHPLERLPVERRGALEREPAPLESSVD